MSNIAEFVIESSRCSHCPKKAHAILRVRVSEEWVQTGEFMLGARSSGHTFTHQTIYCDLCGTQCTVFPTACREAAEAELKQKKEAEQEKRLKAEERRRQRRWRMGL